MRAESGKIQANTNLAWRIIWVQLPQAAPIFHPLLGISASETRKRSRLQKPGHQRDREQAWYAHPMNKIKPLFNAICRSYLKLVEVLGVAHRMPSLLLSVILLRSLGV